MSENRKRLILICAICLIVMILAIVGLVLLTSQKNNPDVQTTPVEQVDTEIDETQTPEKGDEETDEPEKEESKKDEETDKPEKDDPKQDEEETDKPEKDDPKQDEEETDEPEKDDPKQDEEETDEPEKDDPKQDEEETDEPEKDDPEQDEEDEITQPPEEVPPVVEIPDDDGVLGIQFPCEVPGHDLKIEKLAPYSGLYVEDGTNVQVTDVAMLLLHNTGDTAVEYTEITVEYEEKTLTFQVTALPAGERMVVQEKYGNAVPEGTPKSASALVVHRAQMRIPSEITVTDNGDNSLTVKNLTGQTIPTVRVFYKYYMENEDLFVGGIAFTVRITNLGPNAGVVIRPSHYTSENSRVVMAAIYDTEV